MNQKKRFAIFSGFTHILPFVVTECMVGDAIAGGGSAPVFLQPFSCTCNLSEKISALVAGNPAPACMQCEQERAVLRRSTPNFEHFILSDFNDTEDLSIIQKHLADLTPENVCELVFKGVKVGRIALYDVLSKNKQNHLNFDPTDEIWSEVKKSIATCLFIIQWLDRFLSQHPLDGLIVYNISYSINHTACALIQKKGISFFSMTNGLSLRHVWDSLIFTHGNLGSYAQACKNNWLPFYEQRRLTQDEVRLIGDHFRELFAGKMPHAYSAPPGSTTCDNLINTINPDGNRRILLAATSSSDERFSAEQSGSTPTPPKEADLFASHADWLEYLIAQVRSSPELALIIRVHPREFPNKRDPQLSTNARRMKELFRDLPGNVVINWPTDNISLYDLIPRVELVITCWSSAGLEASLFGCPIVLPKNPAVSYDAAADAVAENKEDYWQAVLHYSAQPWNLTRSLKTFHWLWLVHFAVNVSLISTKTRKATWPERLSHLEDIWRKQIRRRFPNLIKRKASAWGGDYLKLVNRRQDFAGGEALRQTLFNNFDPMKDFRILQKLQNGREGAIDGPVSAEEEISAVMAEIKELAETLEAGPGGVSGLNEKFRTVITSTKKSGT